MPIQLPAPIDLYVEAENSGEVEALSQCFAPDATVRDEKRTYEGLAAINTARLTGDFPGSPVTLEFVFVDEGGKIRSLEIH